MNREFETVDEFLARGGYIKKIVTKYDFIGIVDKKFIPDNDQIKTFYESKEWYQLKKGFYQKCYREDSFFCKQCGCTNEKVMRVDHIRSVRYNWDSRLDQNNIQILCFRCNREKRSSEYKATGVGKCKIGCQKCIFKNKKNKKYGYTEEKFCSEEGILDWLADRNQTEIDMYLRQQIQIGENALKKYYEDIS